MENQNQNPNLIIENKGKRGTLMVVLVLVALALIVWFVLKPKAIVPPQPIGKENPTRPLLQEEDNLNVINQDLGSLNVSDLDQEFQAIDIDLNNL
jgi:hypothetical protein